MKPKRGHPVCSRKETHKKTLRRSRRQKFLNIRTEGEKVHRGDPVQEERGERGGLRVNMGNVPLVRLSRGAKQACGDPTQRPKDTKQGISSKA